MSSENTALDLIAVEAYLRAHLPNFAGPLSAVKFETGQSNPTFLLKTPARNYVLRRKPMGVLLKSAHAVEREFRIQKALIASNVPVAGMHLLCEDEDIIGSSFYIMDHVVGRNFVEPTLRGLDGSERMQVFENMGEVLADLHMVDINAVGLSDYGPAGNYFERQLARWTKQYRSTETERIPEMDTLIKELQSTLPLDDGQRSLVHGDYRIDNLIFQNNGTQCLAVLDWELSTIGHPYSDLAGVIMQWQMPQGPEGRGLLGVDREVNNIPSDQEFMDMYCAHRGLPGIESFEFYLAFSFFRMAGILQGVLKRAMSGNASNPERAKKLGQYVPLFARHGLDALSK
ncbi:phosphotransferase family protein [Parasedimentitalea marina]|uniref:Phosphotransferase family protein n=1 Tax=Parasedimentitalea marina TaxID=2483033 RepID=A0A3T0N2R2_9RHOB|nr:phosphotransferase family protein [Parasedimentitalea marina]AZV78272.1 phosphotransferase family protein [Parasedimentitalea marina]